MKIFIEYESSWRNSFLEDIDGNNKPLPKKGRKFIASGQNISGMKSNPEYFIRREVTIDTVMGLLNRLIGDQRKLYQSRQEINYYFSQIESVVSFEDKPLLTNEVTYIRNMNDSEDQNSFTGMIKTNDAIFRSDYSNEFWGVLALDFDELCRFVVNETTINKNQELNPLAITSRLEEIRKMKPVEDNKKAEETLEILSVKYPRIKARNKKKGIYVLPIYCSALYLQLERLSNRFDTSSARSTRGGITGISNNGFTPKDFLKRYTTGDKKKIWGNPYIRKERIKGVGEVVSLMTKASGQLDINIDVDREKAKEIKSLIENAGVSSFYLGKKGLAYVTNIDTREVRD
ncbi:MAG: type I-Fv CRISPR-associated protein Cas5fv [Deltaproteobacteria bacterium]|nr:type I-Fv CRISPR-associated protein Cas5fv [Deltaproteobacteria bacterium]